MDNMTLVKFSAPWCNSCKIMEPTIKKVLEDFNGIELIDVNVDEDPDMAIEYKVRTIPTLILKKGNEIDLLVGTATSEQVKEFLLKYS